MVIDASAEDFENLEHKFKDASWGAQQLRRISLFAYIKDQELSELYQLGQVKKVAAKANVVIEGELSRGLYVLLHGKVSVYKVDKTNDNMIRLAFLETGATFGELSLFDDAPRSATVVAESLCFLFALDEKPFSQFLDAKGDQLKTRFYKKCAEDMAQRYRQQNSDYLSAQKLLWTYALRKMPSGESASLPSEGHEETPRGDS